MSRTPRLLIRPKPEADESFLGYILRLTEKNRYETPSWILKMAGFGFKDLRESTSLVFRSHENLHGLAQLTGVNVDKLAQLLYPLVAKFDSTFLHDFFGHILPQYLIRPTHPKICPDCLSELPHCRRAWELLPVTVCPTHRRLLINECPGCRKQMAWSRRHVTICSCEFDWRKSPHSSVEEPELRLTLHIYRLCGLPVSSCNSQELLDPISQLSLNDLLRAVFFIAGQRRGLSAATSRHLVAAGKSKNFHSILTEAYSVFDNWPVNYFRFLDQRRIQERKVTRTYQRMKSALYEEFGSFYSGLLSVLTGIQFDFMRTAFIDYITQNRVTASLSNSVRRQTIEDCPTGQYVLKSDVRRLLGVDNTWINQRIHTGELKTLVKSKGKKRLIFIKVEDVARLKTDQRVVHL